MGTRGLVLLGTAILLLVAVTAMMAGSAVAKQRHGARCPSRARIAALPPWKAGGLLRADVDGDGRPDAVSIRFDRKAPGLCAFYLRVSTAERAYTLKLGRLVGDLGKSQAHVPIREWPFGIPAVEAIVDLGGQGNLIALGDNEGASNLFVDFVGLSHGRFHVVHAGLSLGGSAMDVSGASCARGGPLRQWWVYNAWTKTHPNRWSFLIDTYRRDGWRIVKVAHRAVYGSEKKMWRAATRSGLPGKSLVGCSLARNPSFIG